MMQQALAIVCAVVVVVAGCALILALRRGSASNQDVPEATCGAAQELVELAGFEGPWARRRDGAYVAFIRVDGRNCAFLTPRERDDAASLLAEALSGEPNPYTIHRISVPLDATGAISRLEQEVASIGIEMARVAQNMKDAPAPGQRKRLSCLSARRELIEEIYLPQARDAFGRRHKSLVFVTMAFESAGGREEAQRAAAAFCARMSDAGYMAAPMSPQEVMATQCWHMRREAIK